MCKENQEGESLSEVVWNISDVRVDELQVELQPIVDQYHNNEITSCEVVSQFLKVATSEEEKQLLCFIAGQLTF